MSNKFSSLPAREKVMIMLAGIIVTFPFTFLLSAAWLGVYEWIRSHGFGFWGAVLLHSVFVTLWAGVAVAARIDRFKQ